MIFDEMLEIAPYSLTAKEKSELLTERLMDLTRHHEKNCKAYSDILKSVSFNEADVKDYRDIPFLPVRLFKEMELKSVADEEVVKTMTSSGTSGQKTSKIYLDRTTSSYQQKTMVKIVNEFTGSGRMPMIILDCPSVVKNRAMFSARGAGILGFSMFGSKKIYALDDDMKLDVEGIREFLEQYKGQTIFMFGFTFMVWQYFYRELVRLKKEGITFDLSNGVLIHGGGWKKLVSEAVSPEEFHNRLKEVCGLDRIHDYYGMVEQTGCIYMQCECGHLHASIFSDVIVRNPLDFSECKIGERGILQVVSSIPESYPGHSLLTEDEGAILGEDDCPCGRKGKYFQIFGRLKNAEIRGCSDTFAADRSRLNSEANASSVSILGKVKFLVGSGTEVERMKNTTPLVPFHDDVMEFLNDLSKDLLMNRDAKAFADVVTLGFWLRKSSVMKLKERFTKDSNQILLGRGVVFHIAPSNVAVNYAYSLFTGLLCGNANIVRIPSKDFPQISIINAAINRVLNLHENMRPYICLIRYDRDSEINDYLSAMCDVRVIWGGDATIAELRKSPIGPRTTEVTFADRYSLAVIDSDYYLDNIVHVDDKKQVERIAMDFYNDTYLSDQNACTSPRAVVWTGTRVNEAKEVFWNSIFDTAKKKYVFQQIQGVDKLSMTYLAAAASGITMKKQNSFDNLLYTIEVDQLSERLMNYRGNSGFFYEFSTNDIMDLHDFCDNTHCQTLSYIGNAEKLKPLVLSGIHGVDRIVPIGHTMDFDLVWDGYNLVERLTRNIQLN